MLGPPGSLAPSPSGGLRVRAGASGPSERGLARSAEPPPHAPSPLVAGAASRARSWLATRPPAARTALGPPPLCCSRQSRRRRYVDALAESPARAICRPSGEPELRAKSRARISRAQAPPRPSAARGGCRRRLPVRAAGAGLTRGLLGARPGALHCTDERTHGPWLRGRFSARCQSKLNSRSHDAPRSRWPALALSVSPPGSGVSVAGDPSPGRAGSERGRRGLDNFSGARRPGEGAASAACTCIRRCCARALARTWGGSRLYLQSSWVCSACIKAFYFKKLSVHGWCSAQAARRLLYIQSLLTYMDCAGHGVGRRKRRRAGGRGSERESSRVAAASDFGPRGVGRGPVRSLVTYLFEASATMKGLHPTSQGLRFDLARSLGPAPLLTPTSGGAI